jgi:hypothetical protein
MKKKMKRFANGGSSIDEGVRARAMKSVEGLEGIKGSDIEDETGTTKGSIKRNEYGDLYDSEMKATPKSSPKATAKAEPKTEPKVAPQKTETKKSSGAEPSFFRGTKGYNLSDITDKIKSMMPEGSDRRTEKQKAAGEEPSFLRGTKGYNLPDLKMPKGSDRRTEKQKAAGEEPSFLRGTKGYNLSDFGLKKGGAVKVSSASKRADGCAIRGKTRA